jgi:hypothetical protein
MTGIIFIIAVFIGFAIANLSSYGSFTFLGVVAAVATNHFAYMYGASDGFAGLAPVAVFVVVTFGSMHLFCAMTIALRERLGENAWIFLIELAVAWSPPFVAGWLLVDEFCKFFLERETSVLAVVIVGGFFAMSALGRHKKSLDAIIAKRHGLDT